MKQIFTHGDYLVEFDVQLGRVEGTVWIMPAAQVGMPFTMVDRHIKTLYRLPFFLRRKISRRIRQTQLAVGVLPSTPTTVLLTKGS